MKVRKAALSPERKTMPDASNKYLLNEWGNQGKFLHSSKLCLLYIPWDFSKGHLSIKLSGFLVLFFFFSILFLNSFLINEPLTTPKALRRLLVTVWELWVPWDNLVPGDHWMLLTISSGLLWVTLIFFFLASHIYISSFLQEKRTPGLGFLYQPLISIWLISHLISAIVTYRSHYRSHKGGGNRRLRGPGLWDFNMYIFCLTPKISLLPLIFRFCHFASMHTQRSQI